MSLALVREEAIPNSATAFQAIAVLRDDLANTSDLTKGAALVGYRGRTVTSRLDDAISVFQFMTEAQIAAVRAGTLAVDVAGAVNLALAAVRAFGGTLLFPPGKYLFGSQVTLDRTYAVTTGGLIGERNLLISGYGAEIHTTGAISALKILGGWSPHHNCRVEGFTINHGSNTAATAGIQHVGAGLVTLYEISVVVNGALPAGYGCFTYANTDVTSSDTGCFWCVVDSCTIRPVSGSDGNSPYGVKALGAANALTLRGNTFSGSLIHVYLAPHAGQTYTPNSVNIDGNFFEGPTAAVSIELVGGGVSGVYHLSGCRITNNRFESLNTAVKLSGAGTTVQVPTYMAGNYADTSVVAHLVNPLGVPVMMMDAVIVGAPMGPMVFHTLEGSRFKSDSSSYDPLTIDAEATRGLRLRRTDGLELGGLVSQTFGDGSGMLLKGGYTTYRPLRIAGLQGISASDTVANNLTGSATFVAATSVAVSFPTAEANTSYGIFIEGVANRTYWVTSKATGGFTINASASNSDTVRWLLVRF